MPHLIPTNPTLPMNTESNPARLTFTSAADFQAACKAAKRNAPGGWGQLASALIKAGHGDALNDVLPLLSNDRGQKLVRPNNAREVEQMTVKLSKLRIDGGIR